MNATPSPTDYQDNDARWRAVIGRDARARGAFFYAVRTTGVVCRPGCASRAPRRENVAFYPRLVQALADGFRPCRRCRPAEDGAGPVPDWVVEACRRIERAETPPSQAQLARELGVSRAHLARRFRAALGLTPTGYAQALRAQRFRAALGDAGSVLDASYAAGFGAPSRMYARAGRMLGMSPAQYRAGGAGATVHIAIASCRLGAVGVAATGRGVCAVELGADEAAVARAIAERFDAAESVTASVPVGSWLAQVVAVIDDEAAPDGIPLDIQGTAFQARVWQALREIPRGSTRSYGEVAAALGQPGAARAVARACATNEVAVLVPCHRVVRGDGQLSGYRWGVARKRALLAAEGAIDPGADDEPA